MHQELVKYKVSVFDHVPQIGKDPEDNGYCVKGLAFIDVPFFLSGEKRKEFIEKIIRRNVEKKVDPQHTVQDIHFEEIPHFE